MTVKIFIGIVLVLGCFSIQLNAQNEMNTIQTLTIKQKNIVPIATFTANGELQDLKFALNNGLDAGLTINEIKEVIIHLYAYCGFPRSIRGLQTFMTVLDERQAKGMKDEQGPEMTPINDERSKYDRGKDILGKLTQTPQNGNPTGYAAFAPAIDVFLKEHLFADLFERDILTFAERELVTISVLSSIGGVEPMLHAHLKICLNVGLTPKMLNEFVGIIRAKVGEKEANDVQIVLNEALNNLK